jgi:hypothetical protein
MQVFNSDLANMPLCSANMANPRGPVSIGSILTDFWCSQVAGLPAAAEWVLVNNRFGSPDRAAWNKVGLLLTGGAAGGSTTTTLSSQASVSKPRSQLLFGPAW